MAGLELYRPVMLHPARAFDCALCTLNTDYLHPESSIRKHHQVPLSLSFNGLCHRRKFITANYVLLVSAISDASIDIPDYSPHRQAFDRWHPNIARIGPLLWKNVETEVSANQLHLL
jgi:hypothetical protein